MIIRSSRGARVIGMVPSLKIALRVRVCNGRHEAVMLSSRTWSWNIMTRLGQELLDIKKLIRRDITLLDIVNTKKVSLLWSKSKSCRKNTSYLDARPGSLKATVDTTYHTDDTKAITSSKHALQSFLHSGVSRGFSVLARIAAVDVSRIDILAASVQREDAGTLRSA